jgi:hypothetical protein
MRIPRSVIVMTLLTSVPFALAIRAAVKDKARHAVDDDDGDELSEYGREEAKLAEVRAEEARAEIEAKSQRKQVLHQLLGDEPATLGSLFEGVQLGAPAGAFQPESVRRALRDASEVVSVDWDVDAARLNGLTIRLKGDDYGCGLKDVVASWGGNGTLWANPRTHQRAELDDLACTIHFERYAEPEQWLDKGDASIVPVSAVGQPAAKLHSRVLDKMDDGSDGEDEFGWHDIGVAGAMGTTTLFASTKAGKVVAITATFRGDATSFETLSERITKVTGVKPTRTLDSKRYDDGAPTMIWKSKPPIALHDGDVRVLEIGVVPEPQ